MFGGMSHFEGVLENRNKLLNLSVVEHSRWDTSLRCEPLEEINPLGPFSVLRSLDRSHVLGQRNRELVLGNEIEGALRKSVVHLA